MGLDHKREVLEWVLHEVELDFEWVKEHRTDYEEYLKLMIDYDMLAVELGPEKIRSYFHKKMENGAIDSLMPNFMDFFS